MKGIISYRADMAKNSQKDDVKELCEAVTAYLDQQQGAVGNRPAQAFLSEEAQFMGIEADLATKLGRKKPTRQAIKPAKAKK